MILYLGKSIKKLNKFLTIDLKSFVNWLNAKKLKWSHLNLKEKSLMIIKIKLSGKKIYPTVSVKYLGVKTDQHLTWQHHINDLSVQLNRAKCFTT